MEQLTPTLIEQQLNDLKAIGAPVSQGTITAHKPGEQGANRLVLERWLPTWIRNSYINHRLFEKANSTEYLMASAKGLPAVIVGIGPSLDSDIEKLINYQKNCVIISTDAALRPLTVKNIKPHIVVTVDASQKQYTLFTGVDTQDIVLVAPTTTDPATLLAWQGPILLFNMAHPGLEFADIVLPSAFPQLRSICVHGTVGNTATLLAYQMGCKQIIAVGMDLCYGKRNDAWQYRCHDYFWHASVSPEGDPQYRWLQKECKELYDNDLRVRDAYDVELKDKKFMVDAELELYRKSLFELVGSFTNVPFTNCSIDGILGAAGFYTQKFEDALAEHCSRQPYPGESVALHLPKILQRRDKND